MKLIENYKKRKRTKELTIESLKEELLEAYRKIDQKDQKIIELFYIRDEKQKKINELLEENRELRERNGKKRLSKTSGKVQ